MSIDAQDYLKNGVIGILVLATFANYGVYPKMHKYYILICCDHLERSRLLYEANHTYFAQLAVWAMVTEELQKLPQEDIFESIVSFPWVSKLVISKKERRTNVGHLLTFARPTTEDLIPQCHGSEIFTKLDLQKGIYKSHWHCSPGTQQVFFYAFGPILL